MEPYIFVGSEQPPPHNPKLKKRTKTGCLTCRKRRIKCGEERPTCNNCHKSKRHCEGYTQRVVFKSSTQWMQGQDAGQRTLQYHTYNLPGHNRYVPQPLQLFMPPPPPGQVSFAPNGYAYDQNGQAVSVSPIGPVTPGTPNTAGYYLWGPNGVPTFAQQPLPQGGWHTGTHQPAPGPHGGHHWANAAEENVTHVPPAQASSTAQPVFSFAPPQPTPQDEISPYLHAPQGAAELPWQPEVPQGDQSPRKLSPPEVKQEPTTSFATQSGFTHTSPDQDSGYGHSASLHGQYSDTQAIDGGIELPSSARHAIGTSAHDDIVLVNGVPEELIIDSPNEFLQGAAIEAQDDDYNDYDPEIDDAAVMINSEKDLSLIRHIHQQSISNSAMRRYDTFLYPGVLDFYYAEYHALPLRNERTARVFAHFICATAPSLGIFERQPRNTEAIFGNMGSLHTHQQSLWTYALPMRALHDFGLLHAILALSSLHIANLQGADSTPSVRHYLYAIRSVHKAVASKQKRHRVETLAATLLLGYYEVMTADHAKWCSHLLGARQLLNEIGYPSMTKQARRLRAQEQAFPQMDEYGNLHPSFPTAHHSATSSQNDIDETLVGTLIGRKLKYDEFGQVIDTQEPPSGKQHQATSPGSEQVDLETYDLYQDLWWFFLRQDAYQSIVSGNGLLLNFSRWSDCPPRARMGRSDATYGGHDHIMLILGRIADFSSRDRRRKLRYIKSHGGQWTPPPRGFFPGLGHMPPPPQMPPPHGSVGSAPGSTAQRSGGVEPASDQNRVISPNIVLHQAASASPAFVHPGHQNTTQQHPAVWNNPQQGRAAPARPPPAAAQPQFMGMAPSSERQWMPSSYRGAQPVHDASSPTSSEGSTSDEEALITALQEWSSIQSALSVLRSTFQPMLQPIGTGLAIAQPNSVPNEPFGPSIHYRQFDVAVLNALYHLCYIILCRAHPNMPPASMVAAGCAASFTGESAMQIGRIATGIFSQALSSLTTARLRSNGNPSDTIPGLNPSIGGMLCEMTMPLFFAGVQYREQAQREWLVDNLREIEVRCGWATAGMIGTGCETAWRRQAEARRGPPYVRRGYWVKPDADDGIKAPWSYGVRGGDADAPPPTGISALVGQQGVATEGLPTRERAAGGDGRAQHDALVEQALAVGHIKAFSAHGILSEEAG